MPLLKTIFNHCNILFYIFIIAIPFNGIAKQPHIHSGGTDLKVSSEDKPVVATSDETSVLPIFFLNGKKMMLTLGDKPMSELFPYYDLLKIEQGTVEAIQDLLDDLSSSENEKKEFALKFAADHKNFFSEIQKQVILDKIMQIYQVDKTTKQAEFNAPLSLLYNNLWIKFDPLPEKILSEFQKDLNSINKSAKLRAAALLLREVPNEAIKDIILQEQGKHKDALPNLLRMFKGSPKAMEYILPHFIKELADNPAPPFTGNIMLDLLKASTNVPKIAKRKYLLLTLHYLSSNDVGQLSQTSPNYDVETASQIEAVQRATNYGDIPTPKERHKILKMFTPAIAYFTEDLTYIDSEISILAALSLAEIAPETAGVKEVLQSCIKERNGKQKAYCRDMLEINYGLLR